MAEKPASSKPGFVRFFTFRSDFTGHQMEQNGLGGAFVGMGRILWREAKPFWTLLTFAVLQLCLHPFVKLAELILDL